jgi:hypothetical protein
LEREQGKDFPSFPLAKAKDSLLIKRKHLEGVGISWAN